jgi:DNA-binding LacI/PurR family transcriptional regulator
MLETAMTSMVVPSPEMARAALHLLVDQIEAADKTRPSRPHIVFNASLLEGETT